ncbi:hypothetical protein C3747_21g332 [Trypanosoma cruzi]|uniref:SET domain-containing protein n=2 Tax=Trypanosoma cruzi TaxID=5693 RepID=Q4D225_TRYCC|nr:hypothetical protein, conserved [Trypanosoma cruzi]EAN86579.1 hypothetical protein, conserved [Trypanosoma cruzi]PWV16839.1 hypothetical protein C3747_21g332 [Trypanosoma cruzi]RNC43803.1 hypothetical protein TcCL_NonESM06502 [Trypanosoma cruzi]|eukprot:XP_808430.1 hypothetical protein [Trypanosoma cruzi strain CL Brener]
MDPVGEAVLYLTRTFEKMSVPCRVHNTSEKGKHVIATAEIPAQSDLFEEAPIVSWPAQGYVALDIPFCSHCLRQQANSDAANTQNDSLWRTCDGCGSYFCSDNCEFSSKMAHHILCGALRQLREEEDVGSFDTDAGKRFDLTITKESLARCVAWVVARIATSIKQQRFSGEFLERHHTENEESISRQLFHIACAPFNRLIDAPKGTEFGDVDALSWYRTVDRLLREPCRIALLEATLPPRSENDAWALEIVDALLRHDTLETFLGQMSLNSQAINGFIVQSSSGEKAFSAIPLVEWVLKGGAVYALQSAFNHSCDPNVSVSNVDGTHDITLRTLRPVKSGEELTITYIPLENTTPEQRNEKLKGYFFTCRCLRCQEENNGERERENEGEGRSKEN